MERPSSRSGETNAEDSSRPKEEGVLTTGNEENHSPAEKSIEAGNSQDEQVSTSKDPEKGQNDTQAPHSILTHRQKIFVITLSSFASFVSPVSNIIYFPAIDTIAKDIGVTVAVLNTTITAFMIFQGIAPTFIGTLSDLKGRRIAYLVCMVITLGANIGLALQDSYAALFVLRCVQSSGSSGTVAIGGAVVADVATRAERGKYMGYEYLGIMLGPSLGPLIGGLLSNYLGWRAIFWFLAIYALCVLTIMALFFPETCRAIVGNGSVPPQRWNVSLWTLKRKRTPPEQRVPEDRSTILRPKKRPNLLSSLRIVADRNSGIVLFVGAIVISGFFVILASLTPTLKSAYRYNDLEIGLVYLAFGMGSIFTRWTVGKVVDWNFRRHARLAGIEIVENRQQNMDEFPVERARLEIALPSLYLSAAVVVAYGWVIERQAHIAAVAVLLFVLGSVLTGVFNTLLTLNIDLNMASPAIAMAAANLVRCLMSAAAVAATVPVQNAIGIGWLGVLIAGVWVAASPALWAVHVWGYGWRQEALCKEREKEERERVEGKPEGRLHRLWREKVRRQAARDQTVDEESPEAGLERQGQDPGSKEQPDGQVEKELRPGSLDKKTLTDKGLKRAKADALYENLIES